jgi:hypothetical protein
LVPGGRRLKHQLAPRSLRWPGLRSVYELGLSRFKVARLLGTARASGLVRIEIADPDMIDVDLSARLEGAYDEDPNMLRERLGQCRSRTRLCRK